MAKAKAQKDIIRKFQVDGHIQYIGYGKGNFGGEDKTQLSFIPSDPDGLREELSALYIEAGTDEKWLPDFVAKDKDRINLSSQYDVPVLVMNGGHAVETNVRDFIQNYGSPVKGTAITIIIKFKDGSLYPVAIKFADDLSKIETYSLANMFE